MKRSIFVIVATVLGIAIYWLTATSGKPGSSGIGRTPVAAAPTPVGASRYMAERPLPLQLSAIADVAGATRNADEVVEGTKPATPTPSVDEVRDHFETFFNSETVDPTWNWRAADTITKVIQATLPAGSWLHRVECRGTLCRVETGHLDADAFRTYVQAAFLGYETQIGNSGFFASLLDRPTSGSPVMAVVYLAREGKDLPEPEALFALR